MRIKIVRPVKAYWNYEVRSFGVGDEVDGELAEIIAGNNPDGTVEVLDATPALVNPDPPGPPGGDPGAGELDITAKVDVVLAWVGDDPGRAAAALDAESGKDKPRSTLVKALEELAATAAPGDQANGDDAGDDPDDGGGGSDDDPDATSGAE